MGPVDDDRGITTSNITMTKRDTDGGESENRHISYIIYAAVGLCNIYLSPCRNRQNVAIVSIKKI